MFLQKQVTLQQCVHNVVSRLRQWVGYTCQVSTEAVRYMYVLYILYNYSEHFGFSHVNIVPPLFRKHVHLIQIPLEAKVEKA